jgi:signal transduction histidine kinase
MRLQHFKRLVAGLEACSVCADREALMAALLAHIGQLFPVEVAFIWLIRDGEQLHLHRTEGVPPAVASRLQRLRRTTSGERSVARRLQRQGYRRVLAAPLGRPENMLGMVAVGLRRSRRFDRIEVAIFKALVQHAGGCLERLQSSRTFEGGEMLRHEAVAGDVEVLNEQLRLLNLFIAGITHDLNNSMTAISVRVELLLNRLHDQVTLQHLGAAYHAVNEVGQMIRHIRDLVSGYGERGAALIDLNQLLTDSLQIAQSTWFQAFRATGAPVDLDVELGPVPELRGRSSELQIALLCILRHAMDTSRPGSRLVVRTWSEATDERQTVFISISDDPDRSSSAEREEGIESLLSILDTAESQRTLQAAQAIIHNLDGRVTVQRGAAGGTTMTLSFSVSPTAAGER